MRKLAPARFLLVVLFLLLQAVAPLSAEEVLLADRAESISGELVSIDRSAVVLQGGTSLEAGRVIEVRFDRSMQQGVGESTVVMWGGDELRGTIRGGDRTNLELASRSLGVVKLPLLDIHEIRCPNAHLAGKVVSTGSEEDVLYLAGGGYLTGTIDGVSGDGVTIDSPAIGGLQTFPIVEIARVSFADLGGTIGDSTHAGSRHVLCFLRDGSRITAGMHGYASGVLKLQTATGVELEIRRGALANLVFLDGDFVYLSDLEITPASRDSVLPFTSAISYPLRRDRGVMGGPCSIAGRVFAKGLGVHSRSELAYRVASAGGARRFLATVGIDDSVPAGDRLASVVFRVRSGQDGEEPQQARLLYESPVLRSGAAPLEIGPITIDGETLILEVDYADNYHVLDRAIWGAARLVP